MDLLGRYALRATRLDLQDAQDQLALARLLFAAEGLNPAVFEADRQPFAAGVEIKSRGLMQIDFLLELALGVEQAQAIVDQAGGYRARRQCIGVGCIARHGVTRSELGGGVGFNLHAGGIGQCRCRHDLITQDGGGKVGSPTSTSGNSTTPIDCIAEHVLSLSSGSHPSQMRMMRTSALRCAERADRKSVV